MSDGIEEREAQKLRIEEEKRNNREDFIEPYYADEGEPERVDS